MSFTTSRIGTFDQTLNTNNNYDVEKSHSHAGTRNSNEPFNLTWKDLSYSIKGKEKKILSSIDGSVKSGELLAVMGPSGAGKSTLLEVLCKRVPSQTGSITFDGSTEFIPHKVFSFVEQDDALYGVLTVRETVTYAARLSLPHENSSDLSAHVERTIISLGLQDIANNRIGTPIQRGISGGQKRRVTIACSIVARPQVLILDEPTSGLDAASGREVVAAIKRLAMETNTICIATIHQPNYETFALFDHLLLLAGGQVMYNGPSSQLDRYLKEELSSPTPLHSNPSDHAIQLVNTEFYTPTMIGEVQISAQEHLSTLAQIWKDKIIESEGNQYADLEKVIADGDNNGVKNGMRNTVYKTGVLIERNFTNYRRNLLAYGIRLGMYLGMGFLLATVWINLGTSSAKINDRLSVFFFSVAFLGFMSVSGIPSFLEERAVFVRERANGLYQPGSYVLANTITSIPFLFVCTLVYSLIAYFAIGLHGGATHFFRFLIYLFLGVFAAESQSILIAAAIPIFVAALAIAAFANGLWMVVQGYFIRATSLPKFWYYTFHFIDFQTFAFELLVRNDVKGLIFDCPVINNVCSCPYVSSIPATATTCTMAGNDLLVELGYAGVNDGLYVGILIIIILVFRLATWGILVWKK